MPIGVPKVPYRLPGEPTPQWVDLYNRLYRQRLLFMGQELDDELANQLCGIILYLSAEDESQDQFLYINSPGGSVLCGIAVFDMMNYVEANVVTICVGMAASMASLVLAGGEEGLRIALPNSRIMIHQPEGGSRGQASEVVWETQEMVRLRQQVIELYVKATGQKEETIVADLGRDYFMPSREAREYGLVDRVAQNIDEVMRSTVEFRRKLESGAFDPFNRGLDPGDTWEDKIERDKGNGV